MTAIVAVTDGRTVVLGGDSAGTKGHDLCRRADPKVFVAGSYAIGFTTSFRMGQILRYATDFPEPVPSAGPEEMERFMVTELVPAVRRAFVENGYGKTARLSSPRDPGLTEEGQEIGGLFLVGVAGQIFEVRRDFQVARPAFAYSAIGLGAPVALGALFALESWPDLSVRDRVSKALAASESYCAAVRGPFHFVESPGRS